MYIEVAAAAVVAVDSLSIVVVPHGDSPHASILMDALPLNSCVMHKYFQNKDTPEKFFANNCTTVVTRQWRSAIQYKLISLTNIYFVP